MRSWCMICPVCAQRKARRTCPALGQTICTVCCGTKRLVEIACPSDCSHLHAAREHPAAVVKRRQERDVAALLPAIRDLTERQHQLFFLFHSVIARHTPEGFARLNDNDVADATAALASTFETAARGVIYEHAPDSPVARALAADLKAMLEDVRRQGAKIFDHEAAVVLRAIERGARDTRTQTGEGEGSYLALMTRLLQAGLTAPQDKAAERADQSAPASIVLP